jgi:predicted amidohydrolase YtcJ
MAQRRVGRIEHAQLLRDVDPARFAALGVVASVQPAHVLDDRDVADRLWAGRTGRAFPYRTLLDAGVEIVLGSDAPWRRSTRGSRSRRGAPQRDDRPSWHPEQEIPLAVALAASTGPDGPVRVGRRADLCVTDLDPAAVPAATLRTMPVAGHDARRPLDPPRRDLTPETPVSWCRPPRRWPPARRPRPSPDPHPGCRGSPWAAGHAASPR